MQLQILALSGSQRVKFWSTALLRATKSLAPQGVAMQIHEGHKTWLLFNPDLDASPQITAALQCVIDHMQQRNSDSENT